MPPQTNLEDVTIRREPLALRGAVKLLGTQPHAARSVWWPLFVIATLAVPTSALAATPEPLNHFLCYDSHQGPIDRAGVTLADAFDPPGSFSTVTVQRAKRLCAPASTNGGDPTAPSDPAHLTAYTIHQTDPHFVRRNVVRVAPDDLDFEPLTVRLGRADRLLVPASKSEGTDVPDALAAPIDHFKCYRVKGTRTFSKDVTVQTQLGSNEVVTVAVKRALRFCTPVDKNDELIVDPVKHLLCYQVRAVPQPHRTVSTSNQLQDETFDVFGIRELCVPAYKSPGTCGDSLIDNGGEECDPPGPDPTCAPGVCGSECRCEAARCGDGVINQPSEECDGRDDDQCPGFCRQDCTCNPTQPVCSGPVSMELCACTNGTSFCDVPCPGGQTCADMRQGCVDFCDAHGGGPGNCATATCFECDTDEPCAAQ